MNSGLQNQRAAFFQSGRLWLRQALSEGDLRNLDRASPMGHQPGSRLGSEGCFCDQSPLATLISDLFPAQRPVRALTFNKTEAVNWGVPWHQDRVIAIKARHDLDGYSNWSQKEGVWHCEPPVDVLSGMLFVRVHLDGADATSGPMEIAVGSHEAGVVASQNAAETASFYPSEPCLAGRGDVLVLHMLTLHRSRPAQTPATRRTLRVDFSATSLPPPLEWAL